MISARRLLREEDCPDGGAWHGAAEEELQSRFQSRLLLLVSGLAPNGIIPLGPVGIKMLGRSEFALRRSFALLRIYGAKR